MPITKNDVKLLESQRMTDFDDGGGRMTGNAIVDGQSNNIFPDVSELDRTYGRVNLRKTFPAVLTPNTDVYYGAHVIVEKPPQDDAIGVLLFTTQDWNDERIQARDKIERYVVAGPVGPWFLYDVQVQGQQQILLFSRVGAELPSVGDVLYLIENEGQPGEFSQYVRVTEVTSENRTFTDSQGEFVRQIVTCQISDPLRDTYHGATISRYDNLTPVAKVRTTLVADASKYYGVQPLQAAAATGDTQIQTVSVYGQLVPSARTDSPVTDQPLPTKGVSVTSGPETFEIVGPSHTHGIEVTLGNRSYSYVATLLPIPAPGQLVVEYRALGKWYRIEDQGDGTLTGAGSGAVNFSTGSVSVTLQALPDVGSRILFTWGTTVHYVDRAGTTITDTPIAPISLGAAAVPGSVSFAWTSGGLAKSATAAAAGTVSGDATGYFVHATGDGYLEFGANYPDPGSQITVTWDEAPQVFTETITPTVAGGVVSFTLANTPVKPGSVRLAMLVSSSKSYERVKKRVVTVFPGGIGGPYDVVQEVSKSVHTINNNQKEYQLVDDGAGALPLNGTIDYATGAVQFDAAATDDASYYQDKSGDWTRTTTTVKLVGDVVASYALDSGTPVNHTTTIDPPPLTFDLLSGVSDRIVPGTLRFTYGGNRYSDRAGGGVLYWDDGTVAGSVDYDAGVVTLTQFSAGASLTVQSLVSVYGDWYDYEFHFRTGGSPLQPGSLIVNATALDGTALSESSDANGTIASATAEGQVEQEMGVVRIRFGALVPDASLTPDEKSEPWYDPADVDASGNIWKPTFVFPNTVRHNEVVYKYLPLDADILGLDPVRLPSDGRVPIYRPGDVAVIHHTAQIIENAPTDGQVINVGRVRLAKVRITDTEQATSVVSPVAGQVVSLPPFTLIRIVDANGLTLPPDRYTPDPAGPSVTLNDVTGYAAPLTVYTTKVLEEPADYTADLDAGTVTLVSVAAYNPPLVIEHTVADMVMITDVEIDGTLTLNRQLTHDFPATDSYCSSALIIGDMQARYTNLFDQQSWTGVWSDSVIGSPATGTFDEVQYPIQVTNDGAITERWYCRFLNTTEVEIFGEHVGGLLNAGDNRWPIAGDIAPVNPATGKPYFTIPAAGWGAGWATGNVLRFNTIGANYPVWIARSIQQSPASTGSEQFCIQIRGDIDA